MPRASRSAPAISTIVRVEVAGSDGADCAAPCPTCGGWEDAAFGATSEDPEFDAKPAGPAVAPAAGPVSTPAAGGVGAGSTAVQAGCRHCRCAIAGVRNRDSGRARSRNGDPGRAGCGQQGEPRGGTGDTRFRRCCRGSSGGGCGPARGAGRGEDARTAVGRAGHVRCEERSGSRRDRRGRLTEEPGRRAQQQTCDPQRREGARDRPNRGLRSPEPSRRDAATGVGRRRAASASVRR